jgi:hypothetical protein
MPIFSLRHPYAGSDSHSPSHRRRRENPKTGKQGPGRVDRARRHHRTALGRQDQRPRHLSRSGPLLQTSLRALGVEIAFSREGRGGRRVIRMSASHVKSPRKTVSTVREHISSNSANPAPGVEQKTRKMPKIDAMLCYSTSA